MPISRISRDFCTRRGRTLAPQKVSPVARLVYQPLYRDYESLVDVRRALNVMREVDRIRGDLTVYTVFIFSIVPNCQFANRAARNVYCGCLGTVTEDIN